MATWVSRVGSLVRPPHGIPSVVSTGYISLGHCRCLGQLSGVLQVRNSVVSSGVEMGFTAKTGKQRCKEVRLLSYSTGWVSEDQFQVIESEVEVKVERFNDVFVEMLWVSVDPYMRMRMHSETQGLYMPRIEIGKPVEAFAVARVIASANMRYPVETYVMGVLPVAEFALLHDGKDAFGVGLFKVDPDAAPLSYYVGILGMPGLTAWVGLSVIGNIKAGDEVFVSAASGAVGLTVGQLARIKGCRVVGSAGGDDKVKVLKEEFAFDDAFNYKTERDWDAVLKEKFPKGIDIYYENVGGRMLEAVLNNINEFGRIPACGMVSGYNQDWREREGVRNLMNIVGRSVKLEGFLVTNHFDKFDEYWAEMIPNIKSGKVRYKEHVTDGIENFYKAFVGMLRGDKIGKALVRVHKLSD